MTQVIERSLDNHLLNHKTNGGTMSLYELGQSGKRVIMFGGKEGVGKTTCSATTAFRFSLSAVAQTLPSWVTPRHFSSGLCRHHASSG